MEQIFPEVACSRQSIRDSSATKRNEKNTWFDDVIFSLKIICSSKIEPKRKHSPSGDRNGFVLYVLLTFHIASEMILQP